MMPGIPKITSVTSSYNVVLCDVEEEYIEIKTTVTNDLYEAFTWVNNTDDIGETTLGLEVQGCRHVSTLKPAILTLFDGGLDRCLILQLCHLISKEHVDLFIKDMLLPFKGFVGANVGHSEAMLKQEYGLNIAPCQNISDIARERQVNEYQMNNSAYHERIVSKLMMDLIVMRKMPEVEGAVWEKEKLEEDLVAYATLESYVYYRIGAGDKVL